MKKSIFTLSLLLCVATQSVLASTTSVSQTDFKIETLGEFSRMYATPLVVAISKGEIEIVKKFVEYGADVNEKTNGKTPLMYASRANQLEIVKFLVEKGADLNEKDKLGMKALDYAKLSNATEVVLYLETLKS
jgi:uncharacterized protein